MATASKERAERQAEALVCAICLGVIHSRHHYVPYIPRGYGDNKLVQTEGVMHAIHLSTTDLLASNIQKKVA